MTSSKVLLFGLLFLVIIWDFSSRFITKSEDNNAFTNIAADNNPLPDRMSAIEKSTMLGAYALINPDYNDQQSEVEISDNVMSIEQQLQQQGQLNELFVGGKSVRLRAVISNYPEPTYALVTVTDIIKSTEKLEKVVLGQTLHGYQTINLSLNVLELASTQDPSRSITLTVYGKPSIPQNNQEN
jgi:hypothetical protein